MLLRRLKGCLTYKGCTDMSGIMEDSLKIFCTIPLSIVQQIMYFACLRLVERLLAASLQLVISQSHSAGVHTVITLIQDLWYL